MTEEDLVVLFPNSFEIFAIPLKGKCYAEINFKVAKKTHTHKQTQHQKTQNKYSSQSCQINLRDAYVSILSRSESPGLFSVK